MLQTDDDNNLILVSPEARPRRRRGTATRGTHGWDEEMRRAYYQAEDYAKALPEWPPFLVTVDVGHSIELYSDFSLTGKAYVPFPDPRTYRILLPELASSEIRARLILLWTDPHSPRPPPAKPLKSPEASPPSSASSFATSKTRDTRPSK